MPKKIKKEKEPTLKKNKEKLINVNNIHIVFIIILVLAILICAGVGIYVYLQDSYHVHKDNALVKFEYTETLDEGYNVYQITQTDTKQIWLEFSSLEEETIDEISQKKYLDFNEEIYNSGILDYMIEAEDMIGEYDWSLYIEFSDGTQKYLYSYMIDETMDMSTFDEIILKYFEREVVY